MARFYLSLGGAMLALTLVSACDNGPSAVAVEEVDTGAAPSASAARETARAETSAAERPPVPQVDGRPMWSETRRYSAEENAQRAFDRNGETFGARDRDDFVRKAHAFIDSPPRGTLTLVRANGDKLFYDPRDNVFAVATPEGAPRTMFKPDDGMAYWEEQKTREAERAASRSGDGSGEG